LQASGKQTALGGLSTSFFFAVVVIVHIDLLFLL
jgi:hypothetical protein